MADTSRWRQSVTPVLAGAAPWPTPAPLTGCGTPCWANWADASVMNSVVPGVRGQRLGVLQLATRAAVDSSEEAFSSQSWRGVGLGGVGGVQSSAGRRAELRLLLSRLMHSVFKAAFPPPLAQDAAALLRCWNRLTLLFFISSRSSVQPLA